MIEVNLRGRHEKKAGSKTDPPYRINLNSIPTL
jgi:hypothetical protein